MSVLLDFSRYANIIPEIQQEPLSRSLRKIPDFSWLLADPHPTEPRLQGDLLKDFPTVILDEQCSARTADFTVMILNNTCDLPDDRLDAITAVPIVDFEQFLRAESGERSEASLQNYASSIRKNEITELFYLPPFLGFPSGGLALLHLACSVSNALYHRALQEGRRVASFTQVGFYFLLIKLTNHIARPETNEVVRSDVA